MDNLARDAIAARAAGTSYGKWKTMHPQTMERRDEPLIPEGANAVRCKICGKRFVKSRKHLVYCSQECSAEGYKQKTAECHRRKGSDAYELDI